jgi:hypothetical protein
MLPPAHARTCHAARVMGLAAAINLQRPLRAEGNVDMEHFESEPMISSAHFNPHPPSRGIFSSALMACALALAGCGGQGGGTGNEPGASEGDSSSSSGDEAPAPKGVVNKSGSGSVTARIGSAGGSLTLSSGPKVEIPAGSIDGAEDIELSETQGTTAFLNQESERPVGPTFVVSPDIQAPAGKTIRVSIPLAAYPEGYGDVAIAYEYSVGNRVGAEDSEHTRWQYENAKLSGGRAVAELPAVNGYRLQFVLSNLEAQ